LITNIVNKTQVKIFKYRYYLQYYQMKRYVENWWVMKKLSLPLVMLCVAANVAQAADFLAGRDAYIRGDFQVAYQEFLPLAKKGDPKSRVGVGLLYAKGQGVQQNDVEAHRWFTLVAEQKPKPNVFVHTVAVENRKVLTKRMSQTQIAKSHQLVGTNQVAQLSDHAPADNGRPMGAEALNQVAAAVASSPPQPLSAAPTLKRTQSNEPFPRVVPPVVIAEPLAAVPIVKRGPEKAPVAKSPTDILTTRSLRQMPSSIERQQLKSPAYISKTILPGGGGSQTTTIGVIAPNPPTSIIRSPTATQPVAAPVGGKRLSRPLQTAALTPEQPKAGRRAVLIQLGAYKDAPRDIAVRAWSRIQLDHGEIIGDLEPVIIEADLGTKGIYQRLRTGPFATTANAKSVCMQLRSRNQRCYVIRGRL
jgi:hypothetical protein